MHAELRRRHPGPFFDGLYVTWDDLRRDPEETPAGPAVHEWRFEESSRFERHLVTWHVLSRGGVAVRGPSVAELGIHTDRDALARRTRENLATYWTPTGRERLAAAVAVGSRGSRRLPDHVGRARRHPAPPHSRDGRDRVQDRRG
ncbi:hypothetical protein AB0395_10785 [Streptosporangium sp. NPDC051023]|uniref:hypothetical protein n=1 Tax=Streptosporangium sp. NPDC051023 TaxID=3155410 RepID=UPI00344FB0FB